VSKTQNIAWIFPGQGSQKVGMGRDLFDNYPAAKQVFVEADQALGFSLTGLCFEGPEEELRQTVNAQPALVTMSWACYQAALSAVGQDVIPSPGYLAGHSLGEYTALLFAGVLDFSAAVKLARERGRLMQEAGRAVSGGMAAILGLEENKVAVLARETGTWLANINCPGQIVISGAKENIEKAITVAVSRGAARALPLQVSGAFHTPLMRPASNGLAGYIGKLLFQDPVIPVVANTSAQPLNSAQDIRKELLAQLENPVQWQRSVDFMISRGVTDFIEIGAGKVLTGLIKRIDKNVKTLNVGEVRELNNILG
jgi:[acyl-carrier-protein] S-malonyltransferase